MIVINILSKYLLLIPAFVLLTYQSCRNKGKKEKHANQSQIDSTHAENKIKFVDYFPQPTNYVNDYEDILSDLEEKEINNICKNYDNETTTQFALVTLDSQYITNNPLQKANQILNFWGVGQKQKNNGILFLMSQKARKIAIAHGYGIEKHISDSTSKKIIDSLIIPEFKNGNYKLGLINGINAYKELLKNKEFATLKK